jgi:hypothetical protein
MGPGFAADYAVFSKTRPCIKQVASVYALAAPLIGFIAGYANAADNFPHVSLEVLVTGAFVGFGLLSFLPLLLRRRARKR